MAGLLGNGWDDPQSAAVMALAGGLLQGNFGGGLLGANQAYAQGKSGLLDAEMKRMQMENYKSEIAQRAAAIEKQQKLMEMGQRILGAQGPGPLPGQLGSGSFGIVQPPSGQPDIAPPRRAGIENANINDIVGYHVAGGPDLLNSYKLAREGFERKPGTFYESIGGQREYVPDPTKNIDYRNGRVSLLPGALDTQSALTLATEAPKALLNSAGKINLRKNADGTERPVSELSENPTLQDILGPLFSAPRVNVGAPSAGPSAVPSGPASPTRIAPDEQKARDAESIRMFQSELQNPNLPPDQRAGLQRELARFTASQSQPGFPTPTLTISPNAGGYGKTTAQETADAVDKAKRLKQVEADVRPTEQRQNDIAGANYMLSVIDQAMKHPGLETATGVSGTLDPRNYLPGTNAKSFQTLMDQIRGGTFMQAYQNLKGGGQITEVEGKKAENAIARLNTAQSTPDVLSALGELRQVVNSGLTRQKSGAQAAGTNTSFAGDNSELANKPPTPTRGMVRNGYRFKGGDPSNQSSWEKM